MRRNNYSHGFLLLCTVHIYSDTVHLYLGWTHCYSRNTAILLLIALILQQRRDFLVNWKWFSWFTANICIFRTVPFIDIRLRCTFKTVLESFSTKSPSSRGLSSISRLEHWSEITQDFICSVDISEKILWALWRIFIKKNVRWVGTQDCLLKNCWAHLYSTLISFQS